MIKQLETDLNTTKSALRSYHCSVGISATELQQKIQKEKEATLSTAQVSEGQNYDQSHQLTS